MSHTPHVPHLMRPVAMAAALALASTPLVAGAIPPPPTESEALSPARGGLELRLPTLRVAMGATWLETADVFKAGFALDVDFGLIFAARSRTSGFLLWPEITYSYGGVDGMSSHLVTAGLGLHYGDEESSVGWTPRFVAGGIDADTVIGVRNSLIGRWMLFSAELSHTWMDGPVSDHHEVRFVVGIDVLWLVVGAMFIDMSGSL